ncbi:MAG: heterodisulfide reductase-related iron-sulfur binding cluster [Anaerolineae bacterium]
MALELQTNLAKIIEAETGQNVYLCYQCVKCTSGCPLAEHFDLTPNQVMRAVQLGREELVLNSRTIWLCASCQTCTTRCPQGLDIAGIMDELRIEARRRGLQPQVPEVALFSEVFLRGINYLGRLYELGLMAELNLRTHQPFKDLPMGLEMIRKGKIKLFPRLVRYPRQVKRVEPRPNQIAYYPGCALHSSASELDASTRAVCRELGLDLVEPRGWVCCGSSPAHSTDHLLATALPIKNLALIERSGFKEVTAPCIACFSRFKAALYAIHHEPELKARVDQEVGYAYQDMVQVLSLLDLMVDRVGLPAIADKVKNPLRGLKVVSYYGCLLTRPPRVTGAKHPEYPMAMDRVMEALGAESLDWCSKTDCCGANLSLIRTELALELSHRILDDAHAVGAEAIVVGCPLCQANLDGRQQQMDLDYELPILYFTQLMALAFGLGDKATAFNKNMVDPRALLSSKGLLAR